MMKVYEVRKELHRWGRFWSQRRNGIGFASTSITATIMEIGALGIKARSDKHLFEGSECMYVPEWVQVIDKVITENLNQDEKALVFRSFVKGVRPCNAEQNRLIRVMTLLSTKL